MHVSRLRRSRRRRGQFSLGGLPACCCGPGLCGGAMACGAHNLSFTQTDLILDWVNGLGGTGSLHLTWSPTPGLGVWSGNLNICTGCDFYEVSVLCGNALSVQFANKFGTPICSLTCSSAASITVGPPPVVVWTNPTNICTIQAPFSPINWCSTLCGATATSFTSMTLHQ